MTTWLNVKNNAESTLVSGITAGATSLTVAAGEGSKFPGANFNITIDDEILLCTTRSGDVFTVTRAQEGTSAAAHSAGASVSLNVTAGIITELQNNIDNHASAITGIHSFNKSCGVSHSVAQSIPDNTLVTLAFDTEEWDTDNIHNNITNNSRLTCRTEGLYIISLTAVFDANSNGRRVIVLFLNNTTYFGMISQMAVTDSGLGTNMNIAALRYLTVNDYVEAQVKHKAGVTLNIMAGSNAPHFSMARIA